MKCTNCGAELRSVTTDLPFKLGDSRIVVIKDVPAFECGACPEYLLADDVMAAVDVILKKVDGSAELEVVRFAA